MYFKAAPIAQDLRAVDNQFDTGILYFETEARTGPDGSVSPERDHSNSNQISRLGR
jgi:hypothetical protein